jgi:hypothetical protein
MIEVEGNTRLLVAHGRLAHMRRIRFNARACVPRLAKRNYTAFKSGQTWPRSLNQRYRLLVVSPIDKAILDEITTLNLAVTELLSVGKPDALGSYTLAR